MDPVDEHAEARAAIARGRAWLERARNADGSWGYSPEQGGRAEPTLLAAAAGAPWAGDWLREQALGWGTLLLPAIAWELDRELAQAQVDQLLARQAEPTPKATGHDGTIPGWSWVDGTAAWVEPTAYALCSLHRAGLAEHERAEHGRALLEDRQCHDAGWNYGNPVTLGRDLEGQIAPTGWACIALLPGSEAARRGLVFLQRSLRQPSTLGLSLAALACCRHSRDPSAFTAALRPRLSHGGVRDRVDLTALAVAALAAHVEQHDVFWS